MSLLVRPTRTRSLPVRPLGGSVKFLAWIDLEATGDDERRDPILEVGLIITDPSLNDLRTHSLTINPEYSGPRYGDWKDRLDAVPEVKEMHTSNGLLRDLPHGMSLAEVQRFVVETFEHFGAPGDFMLAGSGVSHYDRRFLREQMPKVEVWFLRDMLEIASVRRLIRDVAQRPDLEFPRQRSRKAHRGLHDIQRHLAEARHYRKILVEAALPFED